MKVTPLLLVDEIEPCLHFWVGRLGFEKTVEVPHGDRLGFVILCHGSAEVMLQTWASIREDVPALAVQPSHAALYIEVGDLAEIKRRIADCEVFLEERTTFYGATEVGVREPGGHFLILSSRG